MRNSSRITILSLAAFAALAFAGTPARSEYRFGHPGHNGLHGRDGAPGVDGPDAAVVADGSRQSVNLSGGNGGDAWDGSHGSSATGCYQPGYPDYDLVGAPGGNGGIGGDGGPGGDGGDLTVFYGDMSDLSQILVRSTPGMGGRGGSYGSAGYACRCSVHQWRVRRCERRRGPDGREYNHCYDVIHYCRDGVDGRNGYGGRDGGRGSYGRIQLIQGQPPIPSETPSLSIPLTDLNEGPFTLEMRRWEELEGAGALFAPGSDVRDEALVLAGMERRRFAFRWASDRSPESLGPWSIGLYMNDEFEIEARIPDGLWLSTRSERDGDLTTLTILNAVTEQDAARLAVTGLQGSGESLELGIEDLAGVSDIVDTEFEVKIQTKVLLVFWKKRFQGPMPGSLIRREGDRFHLQLGQLPLGNAAKLLKPGAALKIQVNAVRKFAGRALSWGSGPIKIKVPK